MYACYGLVRFMPSNIFKGINHLTQTKILRGSWGFLSYWPSKFHSLRLVQLLHTRHYIFSFKLWSSTEYSIQFNWNYELPLSITWKFLRPKLNNLTTRKISRSKFLDSNQITYKQVHSFFKFSKFQGACNACHASVRVSLITSN